MNQPFCFPDPGLDFAQTRYPVPTTRGFVGWLQHSGETFVNDWKVNESGQRPRYNSYGQLHMRLGTVFDHPLFGWSNYDGNKSPTTVLEAETWTLGTGLFYLSFSFVFHLYAEMVLYKRKPYLVGSLPVD
ncbi:hypothetical protein AVEN_162937-1 [Araneus ventricosus]|uniref:Uncharacterized protein n=1 Tax=Araneus ventricosus TaxID=182803 RepID=A0A4Y2C001_ARAVE|nr:hypothetical protein AVEN_162937-1 [Araneus ventricosus]